MGASFQAPHVAPKQRPMETHHVSLIIFFFVFKYASMTNHTGMYKIKIKRIQKRIIIKMTIVIIKWQ